MEAIMLASALVITGVGVFVCVPKGSISSNVHTLAAQRLPAVVYALSKTSAVTWFSRQDFFAASFEKIQRVGGAYSLSLNLLNAAAVHILLSCIVCVLFCFVVGVFLAPFFMIAAVFGSALWFSHQKKQDTLQSVQQEMPEILRSLSIALRSGKTLFQAMEYIGTHAKGTLSQSFSVAALSLRCGMPMQEVLLQLNESISVPGGELLAIALEISQRTGSPLGEILATSSRMVEQREKLARLLRTKTAQARLSVKIVCGLPFLMLCVLSAISQDFRQGLFTIQGVVCVAISLILDGVALLIIKKLMQGISQ